jgi:predicted nucleotidyltransferase
VESVFGFDVDLSADAGMTREEIQAKIIEFLRHHNAKKIGIFGSFARKDDTPKSDIDVLVEFEGGITYFELARMEEELSELVGRKVDLVTDLDLNPQFLKAIVQDLRMVYQ